MSNKQTLIQQIQNSAGSLFSRADVLELMNQLPDAPEPAVNVSGPKPNIQLTREDWEEMIADIQQAVENRMDSINASDLIGNVEASIYNGCFTIDSVAIDSSAIADELTDTIDSALRDAIGSVAHLDFVENLA